MGENLRVAGGLDEIEAGMDTRVNNLLAVDAALLLEERVEARLDVVQNRPPAASVFSTSGHV
jgi:hypothetical protein